MYLHVDTVFCRTCFCKQIFDTEAPVPALTVLLPSCNGAVCLDPDDPERSQNLAPLLPRPNRKIR